MRSGNGFVLRKWIFISCMICHAIPGLCADAPLLTLQQVRDFDIYVDGSQAGTSRLKISEFDNGKTVVDADADVKINFIVYIYKFQFRGTETWSQGQFHRLECQTDD
ncbi:MAG: hypothetical protein JWM11_5419, partial [Planctomycetaceae bacterium]|nr:hypothetical protein [Planctomycetaceae bacterium]